MQAACTMGTRRRLIVRIAQLRRSAVWDTVPAYELYVVFFGVGTMASSRVPAVGWDDAGTERVRSREAFVQGDRIQSIRVVTCRSCKQAVPCPACPLCFHIRCPCGADLLYDIGAPAVWRVASCADSRDGLRPGATLSCVGDYRQSFFSLVQHALSAPDSAVGKQVVLEVDVPGQRIRIGPPGRPPSTELDMREVADVVPGFSSCEALPPRGLWKRDLTTPALLPAVQAPPASRGHGQAHQRIPERDCRRGCSR